MNPLELANRYMDIVFSTGEFDELHDVFTDTLKFKGPLFQFENPSDYIRSLKHDPPLDFKYEIIQSFENKSSACLVYKFSKPGISTMMTQTFEITGNKISGILLVFDTKAFTNQATDNKKRR